MEKIPTCLLVVEIYHYKAALFQETRIYWYVGKALIDGC